MSFFTNYLSQSYEEQPKVLATSAAPVQDLQAWMAASEDRLNQRMQEERMERAASMEAVWRTQEKHQTMLADLSQKETSSPMAQATAREQKEMLAAIAAMHSDVEALRAAVRGLHRDMDGRRAHLGKVDEAIIYLNTRSEEQGKREDRLAAVLREVAGLRQELTTVQSRGTGNTVDSGSIQDALRALEGDLGRHRQQGDQRDQQVRNLHERLEILHTGHAELRERHDQASRDLSDVQLRQRECSKQFLERARAFDEAGSSFGGSLRKEMDAHRNEWKAALNTEVGALKLDINGLKKGQQNKVVEQLALDIKGLEVAHENAFKEVQAELRNKQLVDKEHEVRERQHLERTIALEAQAQRHWAQQGELARVLEAEREARGQEREAERETRTGEVAAVHRSVQLLAEEVRSLDGKSGSPAEAVLQELRRLEAAVGNRLGDLDGRLATLTAGADARVAEERKRQQLVDEELVKLQSAINYEFETIRSWHAGIFEDIKQLKAKGDKSASDGGLGGEVQGLRQELASLRALSEAQRGDLDGLLQRKDKDLQAIVQAHHKTFSDVQSELGRTHKAHSDRLEEAFALIRELTSKLEAENCSRCRNSADLSSRLAQEIAENRKLIQEYACQLEAKLLEANRAGSNGRSEHVDFERERASLAQMVHAAEVANDARISEAGERILESARALFDQGQVRALEATSMCQEVRKRLGTEAEERQRSIAREEAVRCKAIAELRKLLTAALEEERLLRQRQDGELLQRIDREAKDRVLENTEQRRAIAKAMRAWHQDTAIISETEVVSSTEDYSAWPDVFRAEEKKAEKVILPAPTEERSGSAPALSWLGTWRRQRT